MRDTENKVERLDALLARLVDESIEPAELAELDDALEGRPWAQDRYLQYLGLHADLDESSGRSPNKNLEPKKNRLTRWDAAFIAAAAAVVALALVWVLAGREPDPIAEVVDHSGALRWTGDGGEVLDRVSAGTV